MKYQCGHKGCDICGKRQCDEPFSISTVGSNEVCNHCINRAVKFTYEVACKFGGTIIDPHKPCGRPKRETQPLKTPASTAENE